MLLEDTFSDIGVVCPTDKDVLVPVLRLGIGDVMVDHASPDQSKETLGLTPRQMVEQILDRFGSSLSSSATRHPISV